MQPSIPNLVQERIRKMVLARKQAAEQKKAGMTSKQLPNRVDSAVSRQPSVQNRPLSCKQSGRVNSAATTSSGGNQSSVRSVISRVFEYGVKIDQYLIKNGLDANECRDLLLGDELFLLRLMGNIKKQNDKDEVVAEREVIVKLQRMKMIRKQTESCLRAQEKVKKLLESRLETLRKY